MGNAEILRPPTFLILTDTAANVLKFLNLTLSLGAQRDAHCTSRYT